MNGIVTVVCAFLSLIWLCVGCIWSSDRGRVKDGVVPIPGPGPVDGGPTSANPVDSEACGQDELILLSLKSSDLTLDLSPRVLVESANSDRNILLHVCMTSDDDLHLHNIYLDKGDFTMPRRFVLSSRTEGQVEESRRDQSEQVFTLPRDRYAVEGLSQSIFEDDSSALKVQATFRDDERFFVSSRRVSGQSLLITGEEYLGVGGEWSFNTVIVGALNFGNAFEGGCSQGRLVDSEFHLGDVEFQTSQCERLEHGGGTRNYRFLEVKVKDSHTSLPSAVRGQWQNFSGAELEQALKYRHHHHNICDSFVLKTDTAQYGITSTGWEGGQATCTPELVVDGAPVWEERHVDRTQFEVLYLEDGQELAYSVNCRLYLDCE